MKDVQGDGKKHTFSLQYREIHEIRKNQLLLQYMEVRKELDENASSAKGNVQGTNSFILM